MAASTEKYVTVQELTRKYLQEDATVKFMLQKLEEAGCSFPVERIVIADCKERMLGGYVGINSLGLLICYNNYPGVPEVLRSTLVHELVHAYDECRVKKLDWLNCKHLACSEVRAARLSGDCSTLMEMQRGHMPVFGYEKACVKRRAQLSVAMHPHCKLTAAAHVGAVLEECYQDTEPFARPP